MIKYLLIGIVGAAIYTVYTEYKNSKKDINKLPEKVSEDDNWYTDYNARTTADC